MPSLRPRRATLRRCWTTREARMLAMMRAGHSIIAITRAVSGTKAKKEARHAIRALAEAHNVPGDGGKYR
jgi:hypothetical protein